jgi:hypothetical protein
MSIEQSIYQFVLGLILGFVVVKTGSLLASVILHAVNNVVILFVNFMYNMNGVDTSVQAYDFSAWNIIYPILVALLGIGLMILIIKVLGLVTKKKEKNNEINNKNIHYDKKEEKIYNEKKGIKTNNSSLFPENVWLIISFGVGIFMWICSVVLSFLG